jgi:hypothetical protein
LLRHKREIANVDDPVRVDVGARIPSRLVSLPAECCPDNRDVGTIHSTIAVNVSRSSSGREKKHIDGAIANVSTVLDTRFH